MAKLSKDLSSGTLHPREDLKASGLLASVGAEIVLDVDGCATVSLDLRGTFVATIEMSGTVDGVNWLVIPIRVFTGGGGTYQASATAPGAYVGSCHPFAKVRARVTAFTSGSAVSNLCANLASAEMVVMPTPSPLLVTTTAAAGLAATLTLPSAAGLIHHITNITIVRFAASLLTPGVVPVVVTTTNLPGALAFSLPADAAAQGTVYAVREEYVSPIRASASAASTIVLPATAGVIWRVTAGYYLST